MLGPWLALTHPEAPARLDPTPMLASPTLQTDAHLSRTHSATAYADCTHPNPTANPELAR